IADPGAAARAAAPSIETKSSWLVATAALGIMSMCYGAPLVAVVALKPIAADLGSLRSIAALAGSLAWLGAAVGGIVMARIAERVGVRWTVMTGALMIGAGLCLCQPLVRPAARHGAGADLERAVRRRRAVAVDLRARHRPLRLAAHHGV